MTEWVDAVLQCWTLQMSWEMKRLTE